MPRCSWFLNSFSCCRAWKSSWSGCGSASTSLTLLAIKEITSSSASSWATWSAKFWVKVTNEVPSWFCSRSSGWRLALVSCSCSAFLFLWVFILFGFWRGHSSFLWNEHAHPQGSHLGRQLHRQYSHFQILLVLVLVFPACPPLVPPRFPPLPRPPCRAYTVLKKVLM